MFDLAAGKPQLSRRLAGEAPDLAIGPGGPPRSIAVDHGSECQNPALEDWAWHISVPLDFIRPGKPVEDACIESFNGLLFGRHPPRRERGGRRQQ